MTAREVLAIILALSVRHKLDYVTTVGMCRAFNVVSEISVLPATLKQFWSILQKNHAGLVRHAYCKECKTYLGVVENLPRRVQCDECDEEIPKKYVKYFITLNIRQQLQRLLSAPGVWEKLQYPVTRQKFDENALEDVLDGTGYRNLQNMEDGLQSPNDFSYLINTDGFSTGKSSHNQAYPILLRLNEIAPALRQKTTLLAGLFIDDEEPDFNLFLQSFVNEANSLAREGIRWSPNANEFIVSRFFPTCFCLDARARASVLNMTMYNGNFGCSFCEHPGVKLAGSVRYPLPGTQVRRVRRNGEEEIVQIPWHIPRRTDAGIRQNMIQAADGARVNGFKGPSVVAGLHFFDIGYGFSPDDLHPIYLGITKFLTNLILPADNDDPLIRDIDRRLRRIIVPSLISRKPRGLRRRHKWKGTEWRNWLLFYAVPCLRGLVDNHFVNLIGLLSKAVFLLSQDSVPLDDIDEAERCLTQFLTTFQEMFGPENMRFNIHMMGHLPAAVRCWGPIHLHSTFHFESWNNRLKKCIKSPKGVPDQIIGRYLLVSLANTLAFHPDLSDAVVDELNNIMTSEKMNNPIRVGDGYVFGKSEARAATEEERELLEEQNIHCRQVIEYNQCRRGKLLCQSVAYYQGEEERKTNNSLIYTYDNMFCEVQSIVTFEHDNEQVCGMFCSHIRVGDPVNGVPHIMNVVDMADRVFVPLSLVRNLALKIIIQNFVYITTMPNHGEID